MRIRGIPKYAFPWASIGDHIFTEATLNLRPFNANFAIFSTIFYIFVVQKEGDRVQ